METPLRPPGLSAETSFMRSSLSMSPALLRAFVASVRLPVAVVGLENMAAGAMLAMLVWSCARGCGCDDGTNPRME